MSNIRKAFLNGKAFIPFITCGDPDLESTKRYVRAMAAAGADLIELGIPFSDPTAEGPVIQAANLRALSGGVTTDSVFQMVRELRAELTTPMVFMTYANVVFSYGIEKFASKAEAAGIDGIIIPDVPFEESAEFAPSFESRGIDYISMIAPTSKARIREIAAKAKGFLYVVSSLGVTGERQEIETDLKAMLAQVRAAKPELPAAIGFGISTPEQAKSMGAIADGVIVGSAIMRIIGEKGQKAETELAVFVREMKAAANTLF